MKFNAFKPELYVFNFKKSLNFYTNILGFKLEYQRTNPLFAFLSYQDSQIMIQQEDDDEEWHNGKPEYPYGRGINFQIETDNIQKIVNSLTQNNYPLKRGTKDSWYKVKDTLHGCREILVMDPDGYLLRFSQGLGIKYGKINLINEIKIKEYSEEYKEQIKNVIGKTLVDISVIDRRSLPIDDEDLDKIKEIYSGKGRFWVALNNNEIIGTVAIRDMGNKIAKLNRMFVLVEYHGSGVGQKLFDHAINFAKKQGFTKIILNTHELMHRAHGFYEKNNFTRKGKKEDKYIYEKKL